MDDRMNQGLQEFNIGLKELGISLTDKQYNQFLKYYELLVEWNKVMNLTAITEFNEVVLKHFLDSLSLVKVRRPLGERLLDMGTGAGFPGIPLKIAFPELEVVLIDSLNKRINFLETVIHELELSEITAFHGRAEDYGHKDGFRECFDLCVSRAVAKLSVLSEYCLPYVKIGGYFIPYKSGKLETEVREAENAVRILGASIEECEEFLLPGTDMERSLILIHKTKRTPGQYPRTAGKPTKEPIH